MRRARTQTGRARRRGLGLALAVTTVAGLVAGQVPAGAGRAGAAGTAGPAGPAGLAQPSPGPGGIEFYTPPAGAPTGEHGDLVSYRTTTVDLGEGAPEVDAWTVMYQSTDANDAPVHVTGTVLVPTEPASGARPVLSYAFGSHGLAQECAPSLQMGAGTDYETANVVAALEEGYAVVATDYVGYTTGATPTYIIGAAEGHAVLDIVTAAAQVPGSGVSADAPAAVWGYSQGGQAAAWAGELQPTYAPDLDLVGVAAGGIPADLAETARTLDGGAGATFEMMAIAGMATQHPELPLDAVLSPAGREAFQTLRTQCVFEALPAMRNKTLADYTGGVTLDQLLAIGPVADIVNAQALGTSAIEAPVYQYHGQADEIVPLGQAYAAKQSWCEQGVDVTFDLFPSEHITTQFQAAPQALEFIAARVAGEPAGGNCDQATPPPTTAEPKGGDFTVSLDEWALDGTLHLATLAQDVTLPEASTFTALTNLSTEELTGDLAVPDFDSPITFLGFLPLSARVSLEPAGTTGSVSLGTDGRLDIQGTARASIVVESLSFLGIPLTLTPCRTTTPVEFDLSFEGPVSALGSGDLTFAGATTIPAITGCEGDFIGAFIGTFMSGPGNEFTFTVSAPEPVPA